jgi:16S rRNA U1498 N3-methylase RsmE
VIGVFIGPEGGFTAAELESMEREKEVFSFVSLGDRYIDIHIHIHIFM